MLYIYIIYICIKIDGIMIDKNKNFENGRDKLHPLVVDEGLRLSDCMSYSRWGEDMSHTVRWSLHRSQADRPSTRSHTYCLPFKNSPLHTASFQGPPSQSSLNQTLHT